MMDIWAPASHSPAQEQTWSPRASSSNDVFQDSRNVTNAAYSPRGTIDRVQQHQQQQQQQQQTPLTSPRNISKPVKPLPAPPTVALHPSQQDAENVMATLGIDLK